MGSSEFSQIEPLEFPTLYRSNRLFHNVRRLINLIALLKQH